MELLQMLYFKKAAELEHVTKAANELRIAQPALSRTIKAFESELGFKLFDRKGKFIVLNENGKVVLRHVNAVLESLDNMKRELAFKNCLDSNTVTVYMCAASNLLPELLLGFKLKYPQIRLKIVQNESKEVLNKDYDIIIFSSIEKIAGINTTTLLEEEIFIALPKDSRYAGNPSLPLKEFANEEFIALRCGKDLREITDAYCQMAGFVPTIVLESDNPNTVRGLINAGIGISFMPKVTWGGTAAPSLSLVSIFEPKCIRYINMSCREDKYISKSVQLFKAYVTKFFSDLNTQRSILKSDLYPV